MRLGDCYIAGSGLYLAPLQPLSEIVQAGLYSSEQLAVTQLQSIAASEDSTYPPDMALTAAKEAIAASGHARADIAIALHAYLAPQGLSGWHAASYIHRFAVGNASPAIEVGQMSNGGMAALSLALSHLGSGAEQPAALITTADRFTDIPEGRWNFDDGLIPGDGGTAVVVSREHGFARVRSFHSHSDTTLEELHRGAAQFGAEARPGAGASSFHTRKQEYFETHSALDAMRRFASGSRRAVNGALAGADVEMDQIDHWILPNIGLGELQTYYLNRLDVELERTCWSFGRTVGHLGAGDQFAGVHHLRSAGLLQAGQHCALVGIGAGFSWSCAVLEIGDV
jgi:3-oxoacyl-[acyl-carrier-protein] synthase-3